MATPAPDGLLYVDATADFPPAATSKPPRSRGTNLSQCILRCAMQGRQDGDGRRAEKGVKKAAEPSASQEVVVVNSRDANADCDCATGKKLGMRQGRGKQLKPRDSLVSLFRVFWGRLFFSP